ncbi:MAG: TraR/DksA C4-type zinc finger protein [Dehalococcoidia bacterium]
MNKQQLDEFRGLLLAEQQRLEALIASARRDSQEDTSEEYNQAGGIAAHQADVATDLYEREQAMSLGRDFAGRLDDVHHALRKIDDGSYGVSEQSGQPIALDRLRVVPWARLTIEEEREVERQRER